jgi:hypothetical protein
MARKPSALASIFDDQPALDSTPPLVSEPTPEPQQTAAPHRSRRTADAPAEPARRSSHPGKKPVLIHIPEDMHRALRQLSVEEGGEPLTVITERLLRQYLVKRGHTRFAP